MKRIGDWTGKEHPRREVIRHPVLGYLHEARSQSFRSIRSSSFEHQAPRKGRGIEGSDDVTRIIDDEPNQDERDIRLHPVEDEARDDEHMKEAYVFYSLTRGHITIIAQ